MLPPTLGLAEGEPPAALALGVVVGFFVVAGIWKTGGAEVGGTTTGTGVFLVTNTVLVKADPVDGRGSWDAKGAAVLAFSGSRLDRGPSVAAGPKDNVITVRAGWKETCAVDPTGDGVPG